MYISTQDYKCIVYQSHVPNAAQEVSRLDIANFVERRYKRVYLDSVATSGCQSLLYVCHLAQQIDEYRVRKIDCNENAMYISIRIAQK